MNEWFFTSLGKSVLSLEVEKCAEWLPSGYYPSSLQIGFPWLDFVSSIESRQKFTIDTMPAATIPDMPEISEINSEQNFRIISSPAALPFAEKSMDLVVLPHTLDFCHNPHEVLRQVNQILVAEGCIVIIGFNAMSAYGLIHWLKKRTKTLPWRGRLYGIARVQDWLSLLGYDVVGAGMMCYQPPIHTAKWREKMSFLEPAGARWAPALGGVYVIVGRKREMAARPRTKAIGRWRNFLPEMTRPASQRATKMKIPPLKS